MSDIEHEEVPTNLRVMKWISVFDDLPKYNGEYICARHGKDHGAELIHFDTNEDDLDHPIPAWNDHPEHMNGGSNVFHNLSEETIEWQAVCGRVTHWMELPDDPEKEDTHKFYEQWMKRNDKYKCLT